MPGNVRIRPDRFMKEAGEGRMIFFDPISQGLSVVQDTPPGDALVISYTPSVVSDSTAAAAQLADAASAASFMQDQWRPRRKICRIWAMWSAHTVNAFQL